MYKVFSSFKNKCILITEANGFMGQHLIKALSAHEEETDVIIGKPTKLSFAYNSYTGDSKGLIFIKGVLC